MRPPTRDTSAASQVYDQVAALAAEIENDERRIKEALVNALEEGHVAFALRILRSWVTKPARDVVLEGLEADDGNSN